MLLQLLGATAAMYAAASWNGSQHDPAIVSLMLSLAIPTSVVLIAFYPLHAVFSHHGSLLYNPSLRLFGLSSRASHFLFGGLATAVGPWILQADRRGMALVLIGSLILMDALLPALRPQEAAPAEDRVEPD